MIRSVESTLWMVRGCLILHKRSFSVLVPVQLLHALIITSNLSDPAQASNLSHHYLLSFGLLPVFMISPRLVFDHIDVFSLFPVLWQLLRAVKSLVMGKKTFLDPAAGK